MPLRIDPARLRSAREERALSRLELGRAAGVSDRTIERLERGDRGARPGTIRKLASCLGLRPTEIATVEMSDA